VPVPVLAVWEEEEEEGGGRWLGEKGLEVLSGYQAVGNCLFLKWLGGPCSRRCDSLERGLFTPRRKHQTT